MASESTQLLIKAKEDFHEFAMSAPPSEGLEAYLDRVISKQKLMAEQTALMLENEGLQPAEDQDMEQQKRIEREQLEADHMKNMIKLNKDAGAAINKIIRVQWGDNAADAAGAMKSILSTMSTSSKRAFKIQKAWAIADALISTYQGIAAGVKLGWPMAIPAVAWAAATGLAQISKIRSQSFSGGGGGGGGVGAPAAGPAPDIQQSQGSSGGESQGATKVVVEGFDADQLISGRQLTNLLQEASDNGWQLTPG